MIIGTKIRGSMEILKLERVKNAVQITGSTKTKGHIGRSELTFCVPGVSAVWTMFCGFVLESPDCIYGRV